MAEKIRVLIVDDNDDTRDGTRRLLEYEDNIEIVGFADNGQSAVDQARELKPWVILMDINMPVMDGLTATEIIKGELPSTQIIVVSVQDDAHYMRQAFQKGAFDFVAKPITSAELAHAIERASQEYQRARSSQAMQQQVQQQQPSRPTDQFAGFRQDVEGSVIAVMGLKGGVGKTTVAVSLGVGLARMLQGANKKVLIVDGNMFFGDLAVFLNTRGQYSVLHAADMASEPEGIDFATLESTMLVQHESGVKLLLAPPKPGDAQPVAADLLVKMLSDLKREYNYIIVDTAPTFDEFSAAAIRAADRLIIVANASMPALKDARFLFDELTSAEFPRQNILLVLNEVDKNNRITPDQISNFLKHPVFAQIPVEPGAIDAVNQGVPLIAMDSKRVGAVRPLMNLVQLVKDNIESAGEATGQVVEEQRRGGLFGMLGG
jgi:pilus assembly protein CpaE